MSFFSRAPVPQLIGQRLPVTLELTLAAMLVSVLLALPSGIAAAVKQHHPLELLPSAFNGLAVAVPGFWRAYWPSCCSRWPSGGCRPVGRGDWARARSPR